MTGPLRREPGWLSVVRAIRRAQADGKHPTHRDLEDATGLGLPALLFMVAP